MAVGIDINALNKSTPEDAKEKGLARFSNVILGVGLRFANQITPKVVKTIEDKFPEGTCPNREEAQEVINLRNNLVTQANKLSKTLDVITKASLGISTFLTVLLAIKKNLQRIKTGVSIAAKFIPAGLPGAIPAALNDLGDAIDKITFNNLGESKLIKRKAASDQVLLVVSLVNRYVRDFITELNRLDLEINKCVPNANITPVDNNLNQIAQIQLEAELSPNNNTYKGFVLEIEEVPFSPTVTRKRAIGLNEDGIKLIQTNLSFTTNDQVLIEELKFIIDRDNLKAF